ncbi:MAG TPA: GNAT family N-acetyltransferase, partial [Polyangia bacterium]|nr:GNAT family N-acetyltransferase [Polyangia bacterium]
PAARRRLAEAGPQLVDGLGAHRVADGIVERLAGSPSFSCFGVRLRPATPADRDFLFELRNDPSAYPLYGTPRPVEPAEHEAWLERALASAAHRLLVIEQEGRAVGQLRLDFDQSDSRASERAELSISLGAGARGAGLGRRAIAAGALLAWIREGAGPIRAEIHPDNPGSLRAFGAVGFEPAGTTPGGFEELVLQRRGFGWSGELG